LQTSCQPRLNSRGEGSNLRAAIYLRVSTGEQTVDPQRQALQKILELRGWTLVKEYADEGISGAKARDQRPGFDAMCKAATRREFDIVVAWSIDRISRSLINLITFMNELNAVGVQLYVHQQAFDSPSSSAR
jgi:DNA invertase Pin-like site-specific DNA recombinase